MATPRSLVLWLALWPLVAAIRDDHVVQSKLAEEAVIITGRHRAMTRSLTVPASVDIAIRKAKGSVASHLKKVELQKADAEAKQKALEEAEAKKQQQLEAVARKNTEYSDRAHAAREAFKALEEAISAHGERSADFEKALASWDALSAEVENLTSGVEAAEVKMAREIEAIKQAMQAVQDNLDSKKRSLQEAEALMQKKKAEAQEAGEFKTNKENEEQKATVEMHAAQSALDNHQAMLEEAVAALESSSAAAAEAAAEHKVVKEAHDKEKQSLEILMRIKKAITDFYGKLDSVTDSVEQAAEERPDVDPADLLKKDQHLKPAFESYNAVARAFHELYSFDANLYGKIRPSVKQIKENAWQAILLQCDPGEDKERKAEATQDFAELQEQCGAGLWKSVQLQRLAFPAYEGSEEVVDEWWDKHIEAGDIPVEEPKQLAKTIEPEPETASVTSKTSSESVSLTTSEDWVS